MVVRLRFARGPQVQRKSGKNQHLAHGMGALLTPAAAMALALGLWRLAADLKVTSEFGITSGLFSHWQVWLTAAGVLQWCAWALGRYGK
ncbi:MAG: hypothetical protein ACRD96_16965 [Bryobacteraceae bacterium]